MMMMCSDTSLDPTRKPDADQRDDIDTIIAVLKGAGLGEGQSQEVRHCPSDDAWCEF
jgi:hypothetical protein